MSGPRWPAPVDLEAPPPVDGPDPDDWGPTSTPAGPERLAEQPHPAVRSRRSGTPRPVDPSQPREADRPRHAPPAPPPSEPPGPVLLAASRRTGSRAPAPSSTGLADYAHRLAAQLEHAQQAHAGAVPGPDDPQEVVAYALDLLTVGDGSRPPDGRTAPVIAALCRRYPSLSAGHAHRALTLARQAIAREIAEQAATFGGMLVDGILRNIAQSEAAGRYDWALKGYTTLAAIRGAAGEAQAASARKLSDDELRAQRDTHLRALLRTMSADELAVLRADHDPLGGTEP